MYEWENGIVYLISSGKSDEKSNVLDSSASGGDVFFTTSAGLVPGDVDGAATCMTRGFRGRGINPPPSAVPCQGDVCQGPPSVPSLLGAPSSATFNGLGNVPPVPAASPKASPKKAGPVSQAQKLASALKTCAREPRRRRKSCVKQARRRYGAVPVV